MAERYFATTLTGLEGVLEGELRALGVSDPQRVRGGVAFQGTRADMMRACLWLRTAHRVLWTLGETRASSADGLYQAVRRVARWRGLLTPAHTLAVYATATGSVHRDARFVALKAKDAIVDVMREECGERPDVDVTSPDVRVHLRVRGDRVTVALDASGESLHLRGYRTEAGEAPLRETLAAGLLALAGWAGERPLCDPMAGSGTLCIEAALVAMGRAPGLARSFGFERWPGHRPERWEALKQAARAAERPVEVAIWGRDHDPAMVTVARANAERAGVGGAVRFEVGDLASAEAPRGPAGLLVTNPPWGERLGEIAALDGLYAELGRVLRERFPGWEAAVLMAHERHAVAVGQPWVDAAPIRNGPVDVRLIRYV
ncbi:MAG: RNA methyltransferase [Deltaproteobacteria bacterium]|nr:RNA methyltransferase [Deltaproteobacteria bacterium]